LELKEESEKGRLPDVKEKRRYKRFDLLSALAVLGTVAVLLFECFFVFELYSRKIDFIEDLLPAVEEPAPAPVG